jgi:indole-3-acetate monooxygenase
MNTELTAISPATIHVNDLLDTVSQMGAILSQHVDEEENNRRLSRTVLNALREAGLLRLFTPKSLGGFETDPITAAKVVEAVAKHNTAAGWCLMVANTSAWWCNRLPANGVEEIYKNGPDVFIAGAFHPPMKATPADGGYRITGRSPLTSNVHEADWVFVTAFVMEQGQMKLNNGIPEVIGVFMKSGDCRIIDTWQTLGMKATDSNDVAVDDVFVPNHLHYPLMPEFQASSYYKGKLYKFPAIGASIASLIAPIALAVARNAIEELKLQAEKKVPMGSVVSIREKGSVQKKLGLAEAFVQSSRAYLHQEIAACWDKILNGEKISMEERARILLAVTHTNQTCVQAVDLMYSAAGSSGIYTRNRLAHYFTDAQVIRHHGFSNEGRYETAAQIYLGLQPDLPVVAF